MSTNKRTVRDIDVANLYELSIAGNSLVYTDGSGNVGEVVIGSGISFSGGTISATGPTSTTEIMASDFLLMGG